MPTPANTRLNSMQVIYQVQWLLDLKCPSLSLFSQIRMCLPFLLVTGLQGLQGGFNMQNALQGGR